MVQPNGTPEEIPGDNVVGNIIDQVQSEIDLDQSNVVESEVEPFCVRFYPKFGSRWCLVVILEQIN